MDIFARNRDVSTLFLSDYNSNKDIATIVKKIQKKVFFSNECRFFCVM